MCFVVLLFCCVVVLLCCYFVSFRFVKIIRIIIINIGTRGEGRYLLMKTSVNTPTGIPNVKVENAKQCLVILCIIGMHAIMTSYQCIIASYNMAEQSLG